jgi:peptide/nickel transport system permease protein
MLSRPLHRALAIRTFRSIAVLFLAVIFSALLLRFAPGSDVDERELTGQLSDRSIQQIKEERARRHNLYTFFVHYAGDILHGKMLNSESYGERLNPVIGERLATTAQAVSMGLLVGWSAALLLAVAVSQSDSIVNVAGATAMTAVLLSIPSAVLAVFCLLARLPPYCAIAATVFPRVFPVIEEEFRSARAAPHVIFARARGLPNARVFFVHVLYAAIAPLLALAGVSALLAIGVSIPVEALLDSPGIGQLAWKAALARDLPVLVTLTLFVTAFTIALHWCIDLTLLLARLRSL